MNNKLYLALETLTKEQSLRQKAKEQRKDEIMRIAKKCFWKGYIGGIDLGLLAYKNDRKVF